MKKNVFLFLSFSLYMLQANAQITIAGPQTVCIQTFSNYTITESVPSSFCQHAKTNKFTIEGLGPEIAFDGDATSSDSKIFTVSPSVNSVNANIGFIPSNSNITYNGTIKATFQCLDSSNGSLWSGTQYYAVTAKPRWFGIMSGNFYPITSGQYTYTIPAANGATSYTWTLPAGFQCVSGCNTNSITVNIGSNPQSGTIKVSNNSTTLCPADQISQSIIIDECFNKTRGEYDATKISERVVSGDFDNDGREDDIAGMYSYGGFNSTVHVWKSNGSSLTYMGDNGWWQSSQYDATKVTAMVSGDFDRDGYKDDIALFYDYGNFQTGVHVLLSNGSSFSFGFWYSNSSYDANKVKNRVVSGDFDRDGYKDDIAAFYDYGNFTTTIHVWQSTGSSFSGPSTNGWYTNSSYDATKITGRIVSGDFDNDGYLDDITAFYDYGNFTTTLHVWKSTGSSFTGLSTNGWYTNSSYDASKVTGRVVSGDFDKDGYNDDIAAFYAYDNLMGTSHVWKSTGTTFLGPTTNGWWTSNNYNNNKLTYRVVSGNFTNSTPQGKNDIVGFYDYGNFNITAHVWKSYSSYFAYVGDNGYWSICNPDNGKSNNEENTQETGTKDEAETEIAFTTLSLLTVYPNPTSSTFSIGNFLPGDRAELINNQGMTLMQFSENSIGTFELNSNIPASIYYLKIWHENQWHVQKLVVQKP